MAGKDLDLALRIRTDLAQGKQALEDLGQSVTGVGEDAQKTNSQLAETSRAVDELGASSATTSQQLSQVGESAEQQSERIRAMVAASLQAQEAIEGAVATNQRLDESLRNTNANWQEAAQAQSAAMNQYHNAQRELAAQAVQQQEVAETTASASKNMDEQRAALNKLLGQIDPVVRELDRLDDMEQQLQRFKVSGTLDPEGFELFNAKLREQRQRLGESGDAMRKNSITAGQYQQAMRQLPMQITDVATSLASGMPIWMVAIQQGGQIKDSFGGVGAAARALVSAINPLTAAVAAGVAGIALFGLAYKQGSEEADQLNNAIILTGNYAGTSSEQLASMASMMAKVNGTQHDAVAALAAVTSTGKFTVDQIQQVATTAVAMQDATGKAVSETIAEFSKLADDPVKAAQQLNDKYHFLTAAVYAQITALQQQGDALGAAQLAMDAYSQAMEERAAKISDNLGIIERAWKAIQDGAKSAWDEMLGVGRPETPESRLEGLAKGNSFSLGKLAANGLVLGPLGAAWEGYKQYQNATLPDADRQKQVAANLQQIQDRDTKAWNEGIKAQQEQLAINAQSAFDGLLETVRTNKEKREKLNQQLDRDIAAIRAANPDDARLKPENIAKARAAIDEKFKDTKGATTPLDNSAVTAAKNQLEQLQADYKNAQQNLDAQQKAGLISYADYVSQRSDLIRKEKDEVTSAYQAQIAALEELRSKSTTNASQRIELDQKISQARSDMVKAQKNADSQLSVLLTNEQGRLIKEAQAVKTYTDALTQQYDALVQQGARAAAAVGMGANQRNLFEQQNNLDDRLAQQRLDLASQYGDGSRGMSLDEYNAKLKALEANHAAMTQQLRHNYTELQAAQADWTNGAKSAFDDYIDSANNAAGQTYQLFSDAFTGVEDAIVDAVTTGKVEVDDLVRTISADLARMAVRDLEADALKGLKGLLGGGEEEDSGTSMTVGAAAVSASATELAAAGASLITGAAAISTAAAALAAASGAGGAGAGGGLTMESIVAGVGAPSDVVSWPGADAATASADAISSASTQGAAAMGDAITSASSQGSSIFGSALSSIFGSGADMFSSIFSSLGGLFSGGGAGGGGSLFSSILGGAGMAAVAAAGGGHVRGPGTETSDSIQAWLSDNEFVTRAAVVRQPGMLPILHDINARGMAALQDWAARVRHATGGLAGVPAPAMPVPSLPGGRAADPAKNFSASVTNRLRIINAQDPEDAVRRQAATPAFEKAILNIIGSNPSAVKELLG